MPENQSKLSHYDEAGQASMVDVSGKQKLRAWEGAGQLVPVAGAATTWISLNYGAPRALDAAGVSRGELRTTETLGTDIAIAADGKTAIAGYDKGLARFALDKLPADARLIPLPAKPTAREAVAPGQHQP